MASSQSEHADDIPGGPPRWVVSGTAVIGLVTFVALSVWAAGSLGLVPLVTSAVAIAPLAALAWFVCFAVVQAVLGRGSAAPAPPPAAPPVTPIRLLRCRVTVECEPADLFRLTRDEWPRCCDAEMALFAPAARPAGPTGR